MPKQHPESNKSSVRCALELLFTASISWTDKQAEIRRYINPDKYIQHSPGIGDGLQALMDLVKGFDKNIGHYSIEVKRLIAEDDFVFAHCLYSFGEPPRYTAIAEIFRLEGGQMVEHWDVIQDVPDPSQSKNRNGML